MFWCQVTVLTKPFRCTRNLSYFLLFQRRTTLRRTTLKKLRAVSSNSDVFIQRVLLESSLMYLIYLDETMFTKFNNWFKFKKSFKEYNRNYFVSQLPQLAAWSCWYCWLADCGSSVYWSSMTSPYMTTVQQRYTLINNKQTVRSTKLRICQWSDNHY